MNTKPEIPQDFAAAIFPDYIRIVTADAVIGAQYVEKVLTGICLILQTDGLQFSLEDFLSGDSARTRQTLGKIERQLRKTNLFESGFGERLLNFTRRRNRVVHGLFADCFQSREDINIDSERAQEYTKECEWVAHEAAQLVELGFGIYRALGELLSSPDSQVVAILKSFNEFFETGVGSMAPEFRAHISKHKH